MSETKCCPKCESEDIETLGDHYICRMCGYYWGISLEHLIDGWHK